MTKKWIVALLAGGIYIDTLLGINAMIPFTPHKLPWFYYPAEPAQYQERNPYERDCWGIEDDWCWYEEFYI